MTTLKNPYLRRLVALFAPAYVKPYEPPVIPNPPENEPLPEPIYPLLDASTWVQERPGWVFDGTEVRYEGTGHSSLTGPRRTLPTDRRVKLSATLACDVYGPYKARMTFGYNAYTASGAPVGGRGIYDASTGTHFLDSEAYPTAVEYEIVLLAIPQTKDGMGDGEKLYPRLHNLCSVDA